MALFSRKNINNDPINELQYRIDEFINELMENEFGIKDKEALEETLKKDKYQLAKELYDLTHYSKENI